MFSWQTDNQTSYMIFMVGLIGMLLHKTISTTYILKLNVYEALNRYIKHYWCIYKIKLFNSARSNEEHVWIMQFKLKNNVSIL